MNKPILVGLIGLGRHGSRYLRHLLEEDTGGQLVAISRQHVQKGYEQAAIHRVQFFPDYRDLIADPAIQAVLVVTPPALNVPIALEAIAHRKAVLLEKPLAVDSSEGSRIVKAATQAGVPLMTGHTLRYEPVIQKILDIGESLGPWQSLNGTMQLEERPQIDNIQGIDLGVLLEFGIHLLDWIRVMIPEEPLTVSGIMTSSSPDTPEREAVITLTTASGISCRLNIARVSTKRVTHIEIHGAKGRVRGDWTSGLVQIFDREQLISEETVPPTPTIVLMLRDFFQALKTGQPMPITGKDGLRAVELAEACYQAARTGQHVYVK
ncbi:MAG: Gfo/Idh/MocA family oxidoreductase [Nitrospirales bacterium]